MKEKEDTKRTRKKKQTALGLYVNNHFVGLYIFIKKK